MWAEYNPNPNGRKVGDCAVRAVARALDVNWDEAYAMIAAEGFILKDMPSSNAVWGNVLKKHGFTRHAVNSECPDCYTAADFLRDHPNGIYVLGFGTHVATAINSALFDSWDSSSESPQYYWSKEAD